jgi:hypothetical protein
VTAAKTREGETTARSGRRQRAGSLIARKGIEEQAIGGEGNGHGRMASSKGDEREKSETTAGTGA